MIESYGSWLKRWTEQTENEIKSIQAPEISLVYTKRTLKHLANEVFIDIAPEIWGKSYDKKSHFVPNRLCWIAFWIEKQTQTRDVVRYAALVNIKERLSRMATWNIQFECDNVSFIITCRHQFRSMLFIYHVLIKCIDMTPTQTFSFPLTHAKQCSVCSFAKFSPITPITHQRIMHRCA